MEFAVTQLVGNAGGLISKIIKEAKTAQQNKADCEQLASLVSTIGGVLSGVPRDAAEVAPPLADLNKTMQEAHRLVLSCQKRSAVNQLFRASHRADEFSKVNARIDSGIKVLSLSLHIYDQRQKAGELMSKISKEAEKARRNKAECKQLARSVVTIRGVLSLLTPDPDVARPLDELNNTLEEAHELVVGCQKRSAISQIFRGSRRANSLSKTPPAKDDGTEADGSGSDKFKPSATASRRSSLSPVWRRGRSLTPAVVARWW
ncbi:hypothetical protein QYE76_049494 [Lolium multiflorum]|uniref:DUF7792 domain-containing protein n=1 Tax=Lolium multiflorum TaxID=4521 RepID=A0AAD8SP94_LOLMU|nr:hypothetical protein QYE76_049494 [Lolium multiflorum]